MKIILKYSLLIGVVFSSFSQKTLKERTQTRIDASQISYDEFSYMQTVDILKYKSLEGYSSQEFFEKLGNSYYFNNKMYEAALYYEKLFSLNDSLKTNLDDEYLFRYAMALKGVGSYGVSDEYMSKFVAKRPEELRSIAYKSNKEYLSEIKSLQKDIQLHNLDLNTEFSDFGTSFYRNQLVYASSHKRTRLYNWNKQGFLAFYIASALNDLDYGYKEPFQVVQNTKLHESSIVFTKNENVMFFTRNNYFEGRINRDSEGINRLQLYRIIKNDEGKWGKPELVHFNSEKYSVAHPTITKDGKRMYFSSDMPGTHGDSDIWVVDINEDSTLGTPVNLGPTLNTEAKETFPFINDDGDLYFSTNGQPGLGGLDIYVSKALDQEDVFEERELTLQNLGEPINSKSDDFAYFENQYKKIGFISSNRVGGKGDDDIYSFRLPECTQFIEGVVVNKKTKEVIPGANVQIKDKNNVVVQQFVSDAKGQFSYIAKCLDGSFTAFGKKENYKEGIEVFKTKANVELELELALNLEPIPQKPPVAPIGTDLFKYLNLDPIYFKYDKSDITPLAQIEINKVIAYLNAYPQVKIDVRSHTDSRGRDAYNLALSKRRNKSTINYILQAGGFSPSRLSGKGYGETQLVNHCSNGVKCTDEVHRQNRRSEFIVIAN